MKDINIKINGIDNLVKVQRYFSCEDGSYLIYSQDESDSDGNVKIYVVKVVDNNQVIAINTPEEWDKVKKTIVGIINDNKECTKIDVQDLDYNVLNNLEVNELRALRLPSAVMQYLNANQPEFNAIGLDENEKLLEQKTEELKSINEEFTTMMNGVENSSMEPITVAEPTIEPSTVSEPIVAPAVETVSEPVIEQAPIMTESASDQATEEKMGATMEIIMPTKQPVHEEKAEHPKKKKGKFNFKSLFGIKDDEDEEEKKEAEPEVKVDTTIVPATEDVQPILETTPVVEETKEQEIVAQAELPDPIELNPIIVENNVAPAEFESKPLELEVIEPTISTEYTNEVANNDNSGFDFFDNNIKESIDNQVNNVEIPVQTPAEHIEVLTLEEDLKYKKMYEENEYKIKELENKIFEMEKSIEIYEAKLKEIKNITQ